jgi:hypothetical protein
MDDVLVPAAGVLGFVLLVAAVVALLVRGSRKLAKIEHGWRAYARARGYEFTPHAGAFVINAGMGRPTRIRAVREGVSVDVELTGHNNTGPIDTRLVTPIVASFREPAQGAPVLGSGLHAEASRALDWLVSQRHGAHFSVWLGSDGRWRLALGWRGLEQDEAVLDAAIALMTTSARHPPTAFGEAPASWLVPKQVRF